MGLDEGMPDLGALNRIAVPITTVKKVTPLQWQCVAFADNFVTVVTL